MLHVPRSCDELLQKLEAVRLICRYTGCAQRYLAGDAMAGILQAAPAIDAEHGTEYRPAPRPTTSTSAPPTFPSASP
jgi:4-hydroxybutyryl-CoA dehydratase/vinylacetyl-CoA-Delta-isomerase